MELCYYTPTKPSSSPPAAILNFQGVSSSVDRRFSKRTLHPGVLSSPLSKPFLQLNKRFQPLVYRECSSFNSLRTYKGIFAEAGKQGWDFGRFLKTLYFFNGPPSPAKFIEFVIEKLSSTSPSEPAKAMETSGIVLVVGATGGVGRRVVNILRKKGWPVRVLVRNEGKARSMLGPDIDLVVGDITKESTLVPEYFKGVKKIINAASVIIGPNSTTTTQTFKNKKNKKPNSAGVLVVAAAAPANPVAISNAQTRERLKLKEMFEEAYERCRTAPMEGVAFTLDDFHSAIDKFDFNSEVGTKVKGTVFNTDASGALVDITAKSSAFLPVREACIHTIKHVEEAGIVPGLQEEFVIIGENEADDSLILSLRAIQYDLAWERCRQLQAEDVVLKGKVVGANKGGIVAVVEGLRGFVPFSQISTKSTAEELLEKELPLKFVEVDEEQSRLVLSNRKAMADSQAQLGIGSVVVGTVQSLKPYGAFIDIGGINGLLHVSQISHDRVADIATVLQPGDTLKVMILSHDRERGRVSLSTKKLEPTPGDMIRNPKLVFEKAEEMAQTFRQRIAQAEAMARADMLRFQPESGLTLNSDGILGPLTTDLPAEGLDLSDIPAAEDSP